jgi:L-lactate dehydrogenase
MDGTVAIIGAGRVGACSAFALQIGGVGSEILLLDVDEKTLHGEALDLRHGASLASPQRIRAANFSDLAACDIIVVTAGVRRLPGESRLQLTGRNVALLQGIFSEIKGVGLRADAVLVVVTNPVDILTHVAATSGILPPERVIGTGTMLDTARFRSLLAEELDCEPTAVSALIIGEHGDTMVPVWSSVQVNGAPLTAFPQLDAKKREALFSKVKGAGNEINTLKGGSGFAIGLVVRDVVAAILSDSRATLPVSTVQDGAYGLRDVALSVPTVIGRAGAIMRIEMPLSPEERDALHKSASALRATVSGLPKR